VAEAGGVIGRLTQELTKLPGIGPKSAERIAHFLLADRDRLVASQLARSLQAVVEGVHSCPICFNLTEGTLCEICSDYRRDPTTICVVESPRDVAVFERAGNFRGRYHVLGGRLAPLDNVGPAQLNFDALLRRVRRNGNPQEPNPPEIREVILATSPNLEGDGTALFASNLLSGTGVTITRLARGLPSGSSLELANSQMLMDALEGRRSF
jgi:recombination protein RecR